jgi:serine/threonine protein kinase
MIYMAPELLDGKVYSKSIDIWSVGVIMYRLLTNGEHPYYSSGDSVETLRTRIRDLKFDHLNE